MRGVLRTEGKTLHPLGGRVSGVCVMQLGGPVGAFHSAVSSNIYIEIRQAPQARRALQPWIVLVDRCESNLMRAWKIADQFRIDKPSFIEGAMAARIYWELTMLIILGGLPGTGKTAIARELARQLGAVHVRIDSIEE